MQVGSGGIKAERARRACASASIDPRAAPDRLLKLMPMSGCERRTKFTA